MFHNEFMADFFFFSQEADKMLVYDMNDVSDDDGSFLACSLVAVETDFWCASPTRTLDRRRFGMRMIGMLLALSAPCFFPLRLCASLPRTDNWLFSLMSASCLRLRPPAVMTDGWFPIRFRFWPPARRVSLRASSSVAQRRSDRRELLFPSFRPSRKYKVRISSHIRDENHNISGFSLMVMGWKVLSSQIAAKPLMSWPWAKRVWLAVKNKIGPFRVQFFC